MNALVVFSSPSADYVEDGLLLGLRSLGVNTYWGPAKSHLFGFRPKQAPEASCWACADDRAAASLISLPDRAACVDLVLVGNPTASGHLGVASDVVDAAKAAGVPVAVIEGQDVPDLDRARALLPEGPWFVRECPIGAPLQAISIPFALNPLVAPKPRRWADRDIDVLFAGTDHYGRAPYLDALEGWRDAHPSRKVACVRSRSLAFDDWNDLLVRSKLCLCLPGAGQRAYRDIEAGAAGCVLLARELNVRPAPEDYDPNSALGFRDVLGMIAQLDWAFRDDPLELTPQVLAGATYTHAWSRLTAPAVAGRILAQTLAWRPKF